MKKGEWDPPESYHCINSAGSLILVDAEVRKEVEVWLRTLKYPEDHFAQLTITTIFGEETTIIADAINHIYDTTPEMRCKSRQLDIMLGDEHIEQGFPDRA